MIRHADKAWVYVPTESGSFTRREIAVDRPTEQGWFVTSGFSAKDSVVISGAPMLLSEELKSTGPVSGAKD